MEIVAALIIALVTGIPVTCLYAKWKKEMDEERGCKK